MSSSEDDAVDRRRKQIARALAAAAQQQPSSESSSSEDESTMVRLKPVFVPKNQRTTVIERQERENAEAQADQLRKMEEEEFLSRQRERAVQEAIQQEQIDSKSLADESIGTIPPIGMEDTEEEYQAWKLRELKRILLYREGKRWEDIEPTLRAAEEGQKPKGGGVFFKDQATAKKAAEEAKPVDEITARILKQMGGMKKL